MIYISLVLTFFSCEEPKEEVLDMTDILPTSQRDYDAVDSTISTSGNNKLLESFKSSGFTFDVAELISKRLLPNRFGPESAYTVQLITVTDTLTFSHWVYSDSMKVMNAFYNWIDCFGSKCNSFHIGEEKNFQANAMHILVGDSTLIYVEGGVIDFNKWYTFYDSTEFEDNWNYAIEQRKRGRAKWYKFEDGKKVKYE